jgi:hypothetical protein
MNPGISANVAFQITGSTASSGEFVLIERATVTALIPYVSETETTIPEHEAWLLGNKEALASVHRGIDDARHGRVKKLPSFAKYADDEID